MSTKRARLHAQEPLGERIRRLRRARGFTQTELARRIGLSSRMMAYYEIQGGLPSSDLLKKLADSLDVSIDVLAGRTAPKKPVEAPEDFRLWRRVKRIAELPLHDRKTILKMIDAMADARRRAS